MRYFIYAFIAVVLLPALGWGVDLSKFGTEEEIQAWYKELKIDIDGLPSDEGALLDTAGHALQILLTAQVIDKHARQNRDKIDETSSYSVDAEKILLGIANISAAKESRPATSAERAARLTLGIAYANGSRFIKPNPFKATVLLSNGNSHYAMAYMAVDIFYKGRLYNNADNPEKTVYDLLKGVEELDVTSLKETLTYLESFKLLMAFDYKLEEVLSWYQQYTDK